MQNLDPLSYTPEASKNEIRSFSVTDVHFVADLVLQDGGNHWVIFLQCGPEASVRLEAVPGAYPGREGYLARLDIIPHSYGMARHSHKTVTIHPCTPGLTVGQFIDAIVRADNHRYEFTQAGRGCGGWVRDQFYVFIQNGLIPAGYEAQLESAIGTFWKENVAQSAWPLTYGTYLKARSNERKGKKKKTRG
ncbi:hypothetical protein FBEOM_11925 [Fusarium beomiforme]|uniref:DUF7770 domain-containing protein n=1 Tax=Fusarium beomiforme TaxID=44412 RepID=A0A9P5DTI6_9HYPO|nr:hypothetical protein FBEOM_11925 [Fusarium beomiforme]